MLTAVLLTLDFLDDPPLRNDCINVVLKKKFDLNPKLVSDVVALFHNTSFLLGSKFC